MMNSAQVLHRVFQQKITVVLATLIVFGVLGTGSIFLGSSTAKAATTCPAYHTVVSGDTLGQIATSSHSSVQAIAQANDIANVNLIFPGQRFCIPASGSATSTRVVTSSQIVIHTATVNTTPAVSANGSVTTMIEQVFGSDAAGALNIATCESGLNPNAYNPTSIGGSHAAGVFQILYPSTWAGTPEAAQSPYNAMANILAAHSIFVRDGYSWREWTCQP